MASSSDIRSGHVATSSAKMRLVAAWLLVALGSMGERLIIPLPLEHCSWNLAPPLPFRQIDVVGPGRGPNQKPQL